jgi:hypothetical protein
MEDREVNLLEGRRRLSMWECLIWTLKNEYGLQSWRRRGGTYTNIAVRSPV